MRGDTVVNVTKELATENLALELMIDDLSREHKVLLDTLRVVVAEGKLQDKDVLVMAQKMILFAERFRKRLG